MFKWPGTPSPRASEYELADFVELVCWQNDGTSLTELNAALGRLDENDYTDGVASETELDEVVEQTFLEIGCRLEACGGGYPFNISTEGNTLRLNTDTNASRALLYLFMLLATRLNMKDNRVHAEIDGTLLFEELSAEVAREYLGSRSEFMVFGTAAGSTDFPCKINALCRRLKEGERYRNHNAAPSRARDGKLDVVAWKPFSDQLDGKLIVFGQCKTGTAWKDTLTHLQPDSFCRKWLHSQPAVLPVRIFLLSEAISKTSWYHTCSDAGVVFDRPRIVDYSKETSAELLTKIAQWTRAASEACGLNSSWLNS